MTKGISDLGPLPAPDPAHLPTTTLGPIPASPDSILVAAGRFGADVVSAQVHGPYLQLGMPAGWRQWPDSHPFFRAISFLEMRSDWKKCGRTGADLRSDLFRETPEAQIFIGINLKELARDPLAEKCVGLREAPSVWGRLLLELYPDGIPDTTTEAGQG